MRLVISAAAVLLFISCGALAQHLPDFSGSYVLAWPKPEVRHGRKMRPSELRVVQKGPVLRATFTEHGKTRTSIYYLDGRESRNRAAGGALSTDRLNIQFETLLIESTIRLPKVGLEMEQKWQLSPDSRHLMVQITASASSPAVPDFPLGSWEDVYTRKASALTGARRKK